MKSIWIILLSCSFLYQISAQAQTETREASPYLKVGDALPDHTLANMINYPSKTVKLSSFKGKLLILDFWSTSCVSCVASWPKLLELQKKFKEKMQIVLVNAWEDETKVRRVLERRKELADVKMTLPVSCGDPSILKLFEISGLPHIVWIDERGVVQSITYQSSLTAENIAAVLKNEPINMRQKFRRDELIRAAWTKPLFINGNGGNVDNVLWQSILTKGAANIPYGPRLFGDGKAWPANGKDFGITCTNLSISELYRFAYSNKFGNEIHIENFHQYGRLIPLLQNRQELQVRDSSKYLPSRVAGEEIDNLYNYQLICPQKTSREELQRLMQADLQKYFGLQVQWEKRKKKCLVLEASDTSLISYKGGGLAGQTIVDVHLNKVPLSRFVTDLEIATNYLFSPYPIIDATGFKGLLGEIRLNIDVSQDTNHEKLNSELKKYKMSFTLQDREIDILVISEPKATPLKF
jgi:thiol-disulfide isomerase/thioredoxin